MPFGKYNLSILTFERKFRHTHEVDYVLLWVSHIFLNALDLKVRLGGVMGI